MARRNASVKGATAGTANGKKKKRKTPERGAGKGRQGSLSAEADTPGAPPSADPAAPADPSYNYSFPWRTMTVMFLLSSLSTTPTERAVYTFWEQNPFLLSCCGTFALASFVQWVLSPVRRNTEANPMWRVACIMLMCVGAASMLPMNKTSAIHERSFLSASECAWIRETVENVTSEKGWTTTRHRYHPTEDIPVGDIPEIAEFMTDAVETRLQPFALETYGGRMQIFDMFVVRYTMGRQVSLEPHMDGGHVSFDVTLSDPGEFEGGGVFYKPLRRSLAPAQGKVLIHPAKIFHSGTEITAGSRYVLVGFSTIKAEGYWNMLTNAWRLWGALAQKTLHVKWDD